jgi:hypothetical protein
MGYSLAHSEPPEMMVNEDDLYAAMNCLAARQDTIQDTLAAKHLKEHPGWNGSGDEELRGLNCRELARPPAEEPLLLPRLLTGPDTGQRRALDQPMAATGYEQNYWNAAWIDYPIHTWWTSTRELHISVSPHLMPDAARLA